MSYLFDRNFDAETEALTPEAAPAPEPLFTRSDHEQALAEARAAAFEAGYQKGRAEAQEAALASDATRRLQLAEAVVPVLRDLFADAEAHHAALEAQMIDFVLSVFEQLAPDVSAALAEGQARREARRQARLVVAVRVDRVQHHRERRERFAGYDLTGRVRVAAAGLCRGGGARVAPSPGAPSASLAPAVSSSSLSTDRPGSSSICTSAALTSG